VVLELFVDGVYLPLEPLADPFVSTDGLGIVWQVDPLFVGPVAEVSEVRHYERGDELSAVADDHGLFDQWVRAEGVLDETGCDVLARREHQQFLRAFPKRQVVVRTAFDDVAGPKEPLRGERRFGLVGPVPVPLEDVRTVDE